MAVAAGMEDNYAEKDKGPLVYQESKQFAGNQGELFLINVFDDTEESVVTFEVYGMDSQDELHLRYKYHDFDGLFRFNAELMNPNRKEGRFHWVAERISIVNIGKQKVLKLVPEPTDELPMLPVYETVRKIPTGRMDLRERQRLREAMDKLDNLRKANIKKKRQAGREKFLRHIKWLRAEELRLQKEQEDKLAAERKLRVELKEAAAKDNEEQEKIEKERQRLRNKHVDIKEERTEEQDAEDYRQLRARWKMRDAEKSKAIAEANIRKEKDDAERRHQDELNREHAEEIQNKRQSMWDARNARVERKNAMWLRHVLEVKADQLRSAKMRRERNDEFLRILHDLRQPLFEQQLKRTKERLEVVEAVQKMSHAYHEKRAIPKKDKTKGKNAKHETKAATAKDGKKSKKDPKTAVDPKAAETDRVLDAVEAKMQAEIAELNRRARLQKTREKRIKALKDAREKKVNDHMAEVRESFRKKLSLKEQKANERRIIQNQKAAERQATEDKRNRDLERLQRVRAENIQKKERERLARMAAMAVKVS
eukprot:TRINITY_DN61937_c0_g1_i1.p1 TRINITY_DN61937_c0_g1~~TRINITY_DN61937_c0_g1_i1.p1  ORF type:complete len:561 (+),score=145.25 TRINITY_DN61937_c0_g1_i1:67-1683(+)